MVPQPYHDVHRNLILIVKPSAFPDLRLPYPGVVTGAIGIVLVGFLVVRSG